MERAVILPGMQGWSSSGCWVGNAVAWQHGANIASVSASRLLQISANLSLMLPSLRHSISAGKKKKKAHSRSACKDENNIWREEKRLWAGKVAWICESLDYAFLFILVLVWSCGRLTWEVSHNHQHQRNYDVPQHCPVREIHSNEV